MKKPILVALIAATALAPMTAGAQEWRGRGGDRGGDSSASQQRGNGNAGREQRRAERPQQPQQPQQPQGQFQPQRTDTPTPNRQWQGQRGFQQRQNGAEGRGFTRPERVTPAPTVTQPARPERPGFSGSATPPQPQYRGDRDRNRTDGRRDWNGNGDRSGQWNRTDRTDRADRNGQWNRGDRNDRNGQWNRGNTNRNWSSNRNDYNRGGNWNRGWRGDNRYNWQDWRRSNRSIYRLPRYYAPSGWNYGYQRYGIGITLGAMLFSPNYWINDPYEYRLPPAYGPYRWVRYYNDALLVDIDTGEVVDVIYDIFW